MSAVREYQIQARLLALARKMVYLERLVNEARVKGQSEIADALWEQRIDAQHERSDLLRAEWGSQRATVQSRV